MTISAKIVADSVSTQGIRLVTMELTYPRFIHSEFMTHRMFSRNASSSRAIPVEKMLEQVHNNPAMPIHWGKNQPGMQAREELEYKELTETRDEWYSAASDAHHHAFWMNNYGCHKQIVNRILEPFQYIKVIVTATEWDNFFKLRLHPDAQPEMMVLAEHMKEAMDSSTPVALLPGQWHLPFVDFPGPRGYELTLEKAIKCSVARCARVSYLNHDNSQPNIDKDVALTDKLLEAGHLSPFEHVATPMPANIYSDRFEFDCEWIDGITHIDRRNGYWSGNFRGFLQYRQLLGNKNDNV